MSVLPGVRFLEHTADVGIDVDAPSLELLFHRAAAGMMALLRGEDDEVRGAGSEAEPDEIESRSLELEAGSRPGLLKAWLRELLLLHETGSADYAGVTFQTLTAHRLEARVRTAPGGRAVREIKGVTYHELKVDETEDGWQARVIFDV